MKLFKKKKQIPIKLAGERNSVMTIMFDNFGGGPYRSYEDASSGFNPHEKIRLTMGMKAVADSSSYQQEAAQSNFKHHRKLLKKWFGLKKTHFDFDAGVKFVVDGVNRMHQVLSDNTKQIRFIDARKQKKVHFTVEYEMLVSLNSANVFWERREKALHSKEWTDYDKTNNIASVFPLSTAFRDEVNTAHVGSGYRIYVGPLMLDVIAVQSCICETIYHEMSHKILDTDDVDAYGNKIYGKDDCLELAKKNRHQALKIADCWTYFFMEFYSHKFL